MMIDRYTFVRFTGEHATPAGRAEAVAAVKDGLRGLAGLVQLTVGTPADDSAARWDLSVVARFESLDALRTALAGPLWVAVVDDWLAARAVVVKSWSFEVADAL
jgi:hypothetical protein